MQEDLTQKEVLYKKSKKCPICKEKYRSDKAFTEHLLKIHESLSLEDAYIKFNLNGLRPTCKCGCGESVKFQSYTAGFAKFVFCHSQRSCYLNDEEKQRMKKIRAEIAHKSMVGWNKGKTKETDERVKRASKKISVGLKIAYKTGKVKTWSKGKTKKTDERIKRMGEIQSKAYHAAGKPRWHKGTTKETNEKLKLLCEKASATLRSKDLNERLTSLKRLSNERLKELLSTLKNIQIVTDINEYKTLKKENLIFKCLKCSKEQNRSLTSAMTDRCYFCEPYGSSAQAQMNMFVQSLGFNPILTRDIIKPYELDIYVKEKKAAFEFNGCYFHSEIYKHKSYHDIKTTLCNEVDISLTHFFDDEWREKKEICESMIKYKLGCITNKLNARKCSIEVLNDIDRQKFFEASHLDGDASATISFCLKHKDLVVAAMSIKRNKNIKNQLTSFDIVRFSILPNFIVRGAFSKLLKHIKAYSIKSNASKLKAIIDERFGDNQIYEKNGFKLIKKIKQKYWWTDGKIRIPSYKLKNIDINKSETDLALEMGLFKIFGCKQKVFELNL